MAAEQDHLGYHRHLPAADAEARPDRIGRQHLGEVYGGGGAYRRAPRDPETELEERAVIEKAFGAKLVGKPQIARIEDLHLRLDAVGLDQAGLLAKLSWRLDHDSLAVTEIQRPAVEGAGLGSPRVGVGGRVRSGG